MSKTAILLVDFQMDYFANGAMALPHCDEAIEKAGKALAFARESEIPVYQVYHESVHPGAFFMLPGTAGMEIHEKVKPLDSEKLYKKHFTNSFRETGLLEDLQASGVTDLVVMGMMTNLCIDSTVRAAFDFGFNVTLLEDCCAAQVVKTEDTEISAEVVHKTYIHWLGAAFAKVTNADEWIG